MDSDYSIYVYYKGSDTYPNRKAQFFGFYEKMFHLSYKGKPEDKEEAFKNHMSDVLYEIASEFYHFGEPGVNIDQKYSQYVHEYLHPDLNLEKFK